MDGACNMPEVINPRKLSVEIWEENIHPETRDKWANNIKIGLPEVLYVCTVK